MSGVFYVNNLKKVWTNPINSSIINNVDWVYFAPLAQSARAPDS